MTRNNFHCFVVAVSICCGSLFHISAQQRKSPAKAARTAPGSHDPFLDPAKGPISLTKLIELVGRIQEDIETEGRVLRGIEARGVDFRMTVENENRLKSAGASSHLVETLREKAPDVVPPPALPPPAPPTGSVTVNCRPAECEVKTSGGISAHSHSGVAKLTDLPPGATVVEIRKPGYVQQQRTAVVKAKSTVAMKVDLEPNHDTQVLLGGRLFQAMLQAIAGDAGHRKDLSSFSANGSATSYDAAGNSTEWNIAANFSPSRTTIDARNSAGILKLECPAESCQTQTGGKLSGKKLKREEAQKIETNLRQFRNYQFGTLLDRLTSSNTQLVATTADIPASKEQHLRIECEGEAYEVLLDINLLPSLITYESKSGLGSGMTIGYADFAKIGNSRYPRTTEIKFPGAKQGIRVHFDQLNGQPAGK